MDWRAEARKAIEAGEDVVTSVHPDVKPPGSVAIVWCRPAAHLFMEATLTAGTAGLAARTLELEPWDEGANATIRSSDLRQVPLTAILQKAGAQITALDVYTDPPPAVAEALEAAGAIKRGRVGYGDDFYRWVAHEYLQLKAQRGARGLRSPLGEILGRELGRGVVADGTVRDWLVEAARRDFLTSPGRGHAGRAAGPLLNKISEGTDR